MGKTGGNGAQGQKGATGRAGNSNTHLSWVGSGITHDTTGQVLRKSGGSNSWANGYAYTNYVLTSGCSVSFRSTASNLSFMVGLSTTTSRNTTTARYVNIDYAFYPHSGGKVQIYEAGARRTGDIATYSPSDLFTITYDNINVYYYINGGLKRTVPVGSGKRFFVYTSAHPVSQTFLSQISFVPSGSRGPTGTTGPKGK